MRTLARYLTEMPNFGITSAAKLQPTYKHLFIMIYQTLSFLTEQLNNYLKTTDGNSGLSSTFTQLKNVAHLSDDEIKGLENVLVTLVNLSEEFTMKNMPNYVRNGDDINYRNAPMYLNLYVLFSACLHSSYEKSLIFLSHIVEFFQGKNTFTQQNSPTTKVGLGDFRLILDIYSPTFEQANYLWSTLGGKQFPYVLYRVRLVEILRDNVTESRGIIKKIELSDKLS
ncbi:DUF4255 domain-containing protein [Mucilaginibacter endophyticus]|uniref:DUF4255 domain-containing protein n=1 Tax=Mucilaginibacter endophyticus TaxID=2675003 RepID=UPI00137B5843|nr:DUF4255 domain-containing protein [Mucilaginibacter endophyticus]